ncbi:hypothetical protein GCM10027160_14680 [Streptomyces calidiresistens]
MAPATFPPVPDGSGVPEHPGEPSAPSPAPGDLELRPALEAVLMVVDEPASAQQLAAVLERPRRVVVGALRELAAEYDRQGRGFELREVAGGWRFYTRPGYDSAVERFVLGGRTARLTRAALETLAVIAYRQPVSRSRVSAVRGVNCDGVMRTLLQRGLVEEAGTEPETGAILYRTTHYFLERMGMRDLDELPPLAPLLPEVDAVEGESPEAVASPPDPDIDIVSGAGTGHRPGTGTDAPRPTGRGADERDPGIGGEYETDTVGTDTPDGGGADGDPGTTDPAGPPVAPPPSGTGPGGPRPHGGPHETTDD